MIEDLWYKNAIIYSLDVDSFMDANGDGIGDFEGLNRRLDYLEMLGVDVLWLAPFHPSPNRDNGYDVSDYYGVSHRFGSSGDFVEFMHHAKKRGFKVIIDLVVNHTSVDHPWFQEARRQPESRYRSWYIWSRTRPENWDQGMVFPGVQEATWTRDPVAKAYYFHRFYEHQADLNVDNPEVRAEIRRIIGYWLQLGVDGFRVDAVPFLIEKPEIGTDRRELKFEYIEELRTFMQWRRGDSMLLGEANVLPKETQDYFRDGRGMHMMFNFWVNQHLFYALACADTAPLAEALHATRELPVTAQWAHFLRNHDELDLGRLTEEQRERVFAEFGPDPSMQLYHRGIRRRLAPMLGSRPRLELAYSILLALPGTPVLRYGDEIGMGENLELEEREAVRTPMQWADAHAGGFSTARKTVHPVIDFGVYGCRHVNVEKQRRDRDSLLCWMARMIAVRKECPEIGWGTWQIVPCGQAATLMLLYTWRGNSLVVLHNFADRPHDAIFKVDAPGGERLMNLLSDNDSQADERGYHHVPLDAFGYGWYRVGDMNYALTTHAEKPVRATPPRPREGKAAKNSR